MHHLWSCVRTLMSLFSHFLRMSLSDTVHLLWIVFFFVVVFGLSILLLCTTWPPSSAFLNHTLYTTAQICFPKFSANGSVWSTFLVQKFHFRSAKLLALAVFTDIGWWLGQIICLSNRRLVTAKLSVACRCYAGLSPELCAFFMLEWFISQCKWLYKMNWKRVKKQQMSKVNFWKPGERYW